MTTAIAMKEGTLDSGIDKHFGRCAFFFIVNEETGESEIIENPANQVAGCKADVIVKILSEKNVSKVISGDFGSTVQQLLNEKQIQMIIYPDDKMNVQQIVAFLVKKHN